LGIAHQHADAPHPFALLSLRRERTRRTADQREELATSHCLPRGSGQGIVAAQTRTGKGPPNVRLGQKQTYAVQTGMSALPLIATSNAADINALGFPSRFKIEASYSQHLRCYVGQIDLSIR